MSRIEEYREALRPLPPDQRTAYLDRHSGLPGPRGNLELLQAAADVGDRPWFEELAGDEDEYRASAGAVGLGRLLAEEPDDDLVARLQRLAADARWRVREGVATALQRLGDADWPRLDELARRWAAEQDPLVQRAAMAGVCEPRLLRSPEAAAAAVDICEVITDRVARTPREQRRSDGHRALRKALGYGWSVAVAADPARGVPRFRELAADADPDIAWIVRENKRKARLVRALTAVGEIIT